MACDCANKKKKKDSIVHTASWDNLDSDEELVNDYKDNEDGKYVALAVSHVSSVGSLS